MVFSTVCMKMLAITAIVLTYITAKATACKTLLTMCLSSGDPKECSASTTTRSKRIVHVAGIMKSWAQPCGAPLLRLSCKARMRVPRRAQGGVNEEVQHGQGHDDANRRGGEGRRARHGLDRERGDDHRGRGHVNDQQRHDLHDRERFVFRTHDMLDRDQHRVHHECVRGAEEEVKGPRLRVRVAELQRAHPRGEEEDAQLRSECQRMQGVVQWCMVLVKAPPFVFFSPPPARLLLSVLAAPPLLPVSRS